MVKGFASLANRQTFMHPDTLLTFHLSLSPNHYTNSQQREIFYTRLLERLRSVPAVTEASAVSGLPYSFYENDQKVGPINPKAAAWATFQRSCKNRYRRITSARFGFRCGKAVFSIRGTEQLLTQWAL
jgi:hypothetical protein